MGEREGVAGGRRGPLRGGGLTAAQEEALLEAVMLGMAEGRMLSETVRRVAKEQGLSVTPGQVRNWMVRDERWFLRYQRTRALLGQALAEEALDVARESTSHSTATDRILIETLKWAAAKANPAEYGERQTVEHQGAQTLQIKVVEDDAPGPRHSLRPPDVTVKALEGGALAMISAGVPEPG